MFTDVITTTALTTDAANSYFGNKILGGKYNGDVSVLSIMRALIVPRLEDDTYATFNFHTMNASRISGMDDPAIERYFSNAIDQAYDDTLLIVNVLGAYKDDAMKWAIENNKSIKSGFAKVDKVTGFFSKAFKVVCYENPTKRSTVLFVEDLTQKKLHYIMVGIPAYLPWFFADDNKPTEEEVDLLQSMREKEPAHFLAAIKKFANKTNFEEEYIKKCLAGFETVALRKQKENLENNINSYLDRMNRLDAEYMSTLREKQQAEMTLFGVMNSISSASEESEIMEYFLCNKSVKLRAVNDDTLTFVASGYIDMYDEDMASTYIENDRSFLYPNGGRHTQEERHMFYNGVFIDKKIKIKVCAAYQVSTGYRGCEGLQSYTYGNEYENFFPNPHIDRYGCTGEHKRIVRQCVENGDFVAGIEQFVASAKSINFGDTYVMSEFVMRLFGDHSEWRNKKFIELEDGRIVTVDEAIEYLKEEYKDE